MINFQIKLILGKILKNIELFSVIFLILLTIFTTQVFHFSKEYSKKEYLKLFNNLYFKKTLDNFYNNLQPQYKNVNHKTLTNESLNSILDSYDVPNKEKALILRALKKDLKNNSLKENEIVEFTIDQTDQKISKLIYPINKTKKIQLVRELDEDSFVRKELVMNLKRKLVYGENKIVQSLYKSATDEKIPPGIIIEFARIYGFQVDFQRDIRKNDHFQIVYEVFTDDDGKIFNTGNIIFADLNLSGQSNAFYYFANKKDEGHYDINGKSIKKALMKTPINGARLSSSFGMRKHPIDGYNKMHQGTDFAAPEGTPIMASGDGIIIKAGWCGGGGNCVKIKHNSSYSTVYAHMSKFSSRAKKGQRVKQGQIIGYVGSTGKSTGPHLHYEVIFNGKRVNSQTLKLPSGKILKGTEREIFEVEKIKIDVLKSEMIISKS